MNFNRSQIKSLALEYPVGDPFSGPAYAHRRHLAQLPGHRDALVDALGSAVGSVADAASKIVDKVMQDPLPIILGAGIAIATGGAGAGLALDAATEEGIATGWESAVAEGATPISAQVAGTGVAATPGQMLQVASAAPAGAVTDVSQGILNATGQAAATEAPVAANAISGADVVAGAQPVQYADAASTGGQGFNASGAGPRGIVNSVMDAGGDALNWAKQNPNLAGSGVLGAANLAGGVVSGIGQAGIMERKIEADKQAAAQKLADTQALEDWKRRFTQSGSYFDAKVPFQPAANQTLNRTNGTPVYQPGIVAGVMR